MDVIEIAAWATVAFSWVGMFVTARWIGGKIGALAWKIDQWSRHRTYLLCGRAIINDEFTRCLDPGQALRYGIKVMHMSEVVEW